MSLLTAEVRRFRSRRFIKVLLVLAALGFVGGIALSSTQFAKQTPATERAAQQKVAGFVEDANRYREQCLKQPPVELPQGATVEEVCGPVATADGYGDYSAYVDHRPFRLGTNGLDGAMAVAFGSAALAFLIAATFIGAEWSSRSLVALLFWEPRRLTVMGTKLAVVIGFAVALGVVAQAAWLGSAELLASTRGTSVVPHGFWGHLVGTAARGTGVTVIAALIGFGIANAIRNTAASLGIGFVYFAIVESAVRAIKPAWSQWLVTDNAVAFVQHERFSIFLDGSYVNGNGVFVDSGREIVVTHLHAGLLLTAVTLAVLSVGIALFKRRDLS